MEINIKPTFQFASNIIIQNSQPMRHSCCVLKSPPLAILPFVSGLFQTHPSVQATIHATVYSMDQDEFNESLSLTDAVYEPPDMRHLLSEIKFYARYLLRDKFQNLDELWKVAIHEAVIPGTESNDLMKLGTKSETVKLPVTSTKWL